MYQNIFVSRYDGHNPSMVYVWDDEEGLMRCKYQEFNYAYVPSDRGVLRSIYGDRVEKTYKYRFHDVTYEADVPKETRVLTDLYLDSDEPSEGHVTGLFDIEVDSTEGFPDIDLADKEITAMAFYIKERDEYTVFVLDKNDEIQPNTNKNVQIRRYDSEPELLVDFLQWYGEQGFTILVGWNSNRFDVPYLYRRLKRVLGENRANKLSPIGIVQWSDYRKKYQIAGVSSLDYMDMYKKFTYITKPNYRLDTIGLLEVDIGKIEFEGTLGDLFEQNIEKFIEYNLNDVEIIKALDEKLNLIELVRGICHVGHVPYEDYEHSTRFIEGTILTYLHRKGVVCPNKPEGGREEMKRRKESGDKGFTGAFVKDPEPGLYEWVYSMDLQSLYPSIIMTLNISPECKVGRVQGWDPNKHLSGDIEKYIVIVEDTIRKFNRDEFVKFMDDMNLSVSSNGILYDMNKLGVIPEILDVWFKERARYKSLMKEAYDGGDTELGEYYDRRQHIQKIFLNSVYGASGLPTFRFYDVDNALAVTASGQDVIKSSEKLVNEIYREKTGIKQDYCKYIDTDSLYFSIMELVNDSFDYDKMKELCINTSKQVEDKLNEFYGILVKRMFHVMGSHRLYIKGETISRRALWVVKKRYALHKVYDLEKEKDTDEITFKGLDVVRSTFPPAFSEFTENLLDRILKGADKQEIDSSILEFKSKIKDLHYSKIARNTAVKDIEKYDDNTETSLVKFKKGSPAHVKATIAYNRLLKARNLNVSYDLIRSGDKIKYVYLKKNPLRIDALAFKGYEDPPEVVEFIEKYIDHDGLFDRELKKKLDSFYNALKWGTIPTDINQSVYEFFSF